MRSHWIRVSPNPMTGVFIIRDNRDTQGGRPCDHGGRDWSYSATLKNAMDCDETLEAGMEKKGPCSRAYRGSTFLQAP